MRRTTLAAILALATLACGGGDTDPGEDGGVRAAPGAEAGPVGEDPELATDATEFRPTAGSASGDAGAEAAIGGRLWISGASTIEEDGVSLIAQLRNLPANQSHSWAIHRSGCGAADDLLFGLGWGTVGEVEGRGEDLANGGGPLGEMRLTFVSEPDGRAEETVFVPFGEGFTRASLEAGRHSLRIHPDVEGEDPGPSVACAPLPAPPVPEASDPETSRPDTGG